MCVWCVCVCRRVYPRVCVCVDVTVRERMGGGGRVGGVWGDRVWLLIKSSNTKGANHTVSEVC